MESIADRQTQFVARIDARHNGKSDSTCLEEAIRKATSSLEAAFNSINYTLPDETSANKQACLRDFEGMAIRTEPGNVASKASVSIHDHLKSQKLEFWQSLVQNHYIVTPSEHETENIKQMNLQEPIPNLVESAAQTTAEPDEFHLLQEEEKELHRSISSKRNNKGEDKNQSDQLSAEQNWADISSRMVELSFTSKGKDEEKKSDLHSIAESDEDYEEDFIESSKENSTGISASLKQNHEEGGDSSEVKNKNSSISSDQLSSHKD